MSAPKKLPEALHVLRISDGTRGHDNQSIGLVEALARERAVSCDELAVTGSAAGALEALRRGRASTPDLVVGAGHSTHLAILAAARRGAGRSIVLMKPSLPLRLFDLCIIPQHDGVAPAANVMLSLGALNRVRPATERDAHAGLILLGGPSRHHDWREAAIVEQVQTLLVDRQMHWQVAGSPRTPASTLERIARETTAAVTSAADTDSQWLPRQLASAGEVWVSEDSVSMAYEAASSGARAGLLRVPARRPDSRVVRAANMLLEAGHAVRLEARARRADAPPPLQEAERCARELLERWPDLA